MSRENVEVVRECLAARDGGDYSAARAVSPRCRRRPVREVRRADLSRGSGCRPGDEGMVRDVGRLRLHTGTVHRCGRLYRGPEEVRAFFAEWFGVFSFDDWYNEVERLIDHEDKVVAFVLQRGRGSASTTPTEMEMTQISTIEQGKIVRLQVYGDRTEALEAVGLSE